MVKEFEEVVIRTFLRKETTTTTTTKRQPHYAVILHNDNLNSFGYVVEVLRRVFGYGTAKAFWLTFRAHCTGRSVVWVGVFEVAEFKAERLASCGPDPERKGAGAHPLGVSLEPLAV
jgi:ATP-dependent Clp protease adaptor protein ClpS